MEITAGIVKQLRELTGAGMMDCKKALNETNGDIEAAVTWLREKGIAKAAKRAGRIAAEGLTKAFTSGNQAVIVEVNSETDFVARNDQFLELIDGIGAALLKSDVKSIGEAESLKIGDATIADLVIDATATIGEKISFRRFARLEKTTEEIFGLYIHMGGKISTLAVLKDANEEVAKDIAMQVASMNPQFVSRENMDPAFVEKERSIQWEILKNDEKMADKPEMVLQKALEGRLSKSLKEICLVDQEFFKDPDQSVGAYLKSHGAAVREFVRYAVGEGIDKSAAEEE
ncbi:MAG: translation elongation factor Ts [Erysipelotrichaceae bacterium]|jgi:elongation factor Ts|nr:translation elongation factor Ts [Erysipelotrichaceae bacterium]